MQNYISRLNKKGFTLVELLVVISIIGILAGIILVGLRQMRLRAQDSERKSNLAQVNKALQAYGAENGEMYPDNIVECDAGSGTASERLGFTSGGADQKLIDGGFIGSLDSFPKDKIWTDCYQQLVYQVSGINKSYILQTKLAAGLQTYYQVYQPESSSYAFQETDTGLGGTLDTSPPTWPPGAFVAMEYNLATESLVLTWPFAQDNVGVSRYWLRLDYWDLSTGEGGTYEDLVPPNENPSEPYKMSLSLPPGIPIGVNAFVFAYDARNNRSQPINGTWIAP